MMFMFSFLPCFSQTLLDFSTEVKKMNSINEENGLAKTYFSFENKSKSSITIASVSVNCLCVKTTWPKRTIVPGDTGRIVISFDPMNRPGKFEEYLEVKQTNGASINLSITGTVLPRMAQVRELLPIFMGSLQFQSKHLAFPAMFEDEEKQIQYSIYNPTNQSYTINWDQSVFPGDFFSSSERGKQLIPARDSIHFQLTYNASLRNDWNYVVDSLFLLTDDEIEPLKKLAVSAFIHQRLNKDQPHAQLQASALNHNFGQVSVGKTKVKEIEISNTGEKPLFIRKISNVNQCECITVEAMKDTLEPGEKSRLKITYTANTSKPDLNIIGVLSNDPDKPYQIFRLLANTD